MARAKKDGVPFSALIDRSLLNEVRNCSSTNKWTLTETVEELLRRGLKSLEEEDRLRQEFINSRKKD